MALNSEELRKNWLNRYLRIQGATDTKIRTILIEGARAASEEVIALEKNSTFSAGVKSAQIRITMQTIKEVLKDVFGELTPVIKDGHGKAAIGATDALAKTDRQYLEAAFKQSGSVSSFIEGQRIQSRLQVANAITRMQHSDKPLSERVYRTRFLADRWVQNTVTKHIMRGSSAREIAKSVQSSIRPNTPGGVSYAALRLGRTELNNAFHATTVELSKDRPWIEAMKWNLSSTHEIDPIKPEICEIYSQKLYKVSEVPGKPHPQCRCYTTPELKPFEMFMQDLTAGQYRDWINNAA